MKLVALLLAVFVATAHADGTTPAEAYFRAGEQAYQAQRFEDAAQNFEEAYKLAPIPEIAFSAAQAYRRQYHIHPELKLAQRSVELYAIYLAARTEGGRVADASDAIGEMKREVEKLIAGGATVSAEVAKEYTKIGISVTFGKPTGGMHEVTDTTAAPAVKVIAKLDGAEVPVFKLVNVTPGRHVLHAEAEGYFPIDRDKNVAQGTSAMEELELLPMPAKVTIKTTHDADVVVDGKRVGSAPVDPIELPAGHHTLAIVRVGHEPAGRELVLARGQHVAIDAPLKMTVKRKLAPYFLGGAIVAGGLAATALIVGGVYAGKATHLANDIRNGDAPKSEADEYNHDVDNRNRAFIASTPGIVLGLGLGLAAYILYRYDHPSPESVHLEPMVGPTGGGAAVSGHF